MKETMKIWSHPFYCSNSNIAHNVRDQRIGTKKKE